MSRQTIYLLIFIILVGIAGYIWAQNLGSGAVPPENRLLEFEASMARLRRLSTVTIDIAILDDPRFQGLASPVTPRLPALTPGRLNPFLSF